MDAQAWDARYAADQQWSSGPNATVAELVADLQPGRAVDLAAGEGRNARWLAGRGWDAVAVDFSAVGLDRGRTAEHGDAVTWVVADATTWTTEEGSLDLVVLAYLHLPVDTIQAVLTRAVGWLRPGGRLLVIGHDVDNVAHGVGGPQDTSILYSVDRLAPVAALLEIDRLEQLPRDTPAGTALDTLLWGSRPLAS